MINNHPYNMAQRPVLNQSMIFNDSKNLANNLQNRTDRQSMHSSGIFLKNSNIMNKPYQQHYYEPPNIPVSPHKTNFNKPLNMVQFMGNSQVMRPIQYPIINTPLPQVPLYQRQIKEVQQKIQFLSKRILQNERKQKLSSKNSVVTLDDQQNSSEKKFFNKQQTMKQNDLGFQLERYRIQSNEQNKKLWKKINHFDQLFNKLNIDQINKKIETLEQSFDLSSFDRGLVQQQQILNRIKCIQKSIRQMGQDIHLINDKTQVIEERVKNQLSNLPRSNGKLQTKQKQNLQIKYKLNELNNQIGNMKKQLKNIEKSFEIKLIQTGQQFEMKIKSIKIFDEKLIKSSLNAKYSQEPIVLKYIQKFQVIQKQKNIVSHQFIVNELTYFIDNQGYILDHDRYYLISIQNNQRIKLDKKQIQSLRKNRILI